MKLLATAIVLGTASVAAAQPSLTPPSSVPAGPPPAPPPPDASASAPQRHGILAGFDLGVGGMSSHGGHSDCNGCSDSSAAGVSGEIGAMLTARAGILVGFQLTAKNASPPTSPTQPTHGVPVFLIEGAYWPSSRLFVEAGIGKPSARP